MRVLVFIILATLLGGAVYCTVDSYRAVKAALAGSRDGNISAVYSDVFEVSAPLRFTTEQLLYELRSRRYRESRSGPLVTGEYRREGDVLKVFTRSFTTYEGLIRPAEFIVMNLATGDLSGDPEGRLVLEPQIISPLGSGELRATNYKRIDQFPQHMIDAMISAEDQRFYDHWGVDPIGIARAMVRNVRAMKFVEGGSTITQQLAKNLVLSPERTLRRKIREVFSAFMLEWFLTKDEILERYLNEIYLGQEGSVAIHGMAEAANVFFGKQVEDLSIGESAVLAGMNKGPSVYSPRKNLIRSRDRRNTILRMMVDNQKLTEAAYRKASQEPLRIVQTSLHGRIAPYFVSAVTREVGEQIDLPAGISSGIRIYTGLSLALQRCAEETLSAGIIETEALPRFPKKLRGQLEGAIVAIEPFSGRVRAWVGGRDFAKSQFDRVNQALRQIGSTIKPFLYIAALDPDIAGRDVLTPTSLIPDTPVEIEVRKQPAWEPENYDRNFRGLVTVQEAMAESLNLPAVHTALRIGFQTLADSVRRFGISDRPLAVPSLALGAIDTTLVRLTAGFGALANSGVRVSPRMFLSVVDTQYNILAASQFSETSVAPADVSYVLTSLMERGVNEGTGKGIRSRGYMGPAAGKTGTSDESRDVWFVGFTPTLVTGVWLGNDRNLPIGVTGGAAAAPIWAEFMKCAEKHIEAADFIPPRGVSEFQVDRRKGFRNDRECGETDDPMSIWALDGIPPPTACELDEPYAPPSYKRRAPEQDNYREVPRPRPTPQKRGVWERLFG